MDNYFSKCSAKNADGKIQAEGKKLRGVKSVVHEELMTTAFYFKWEKNVGVGVQLCSFVAMR